MISTASNPICPTLQPEFPRVTNGAQAVGGFDQRLAWHAAAQNAKSADIGRALDDAGFHAEGRGCSGAGIPSAPAANDDKIVGHEILGQTLKNHGSKSPCLKFAFPASEASG